MKVVFYGNCQLYWVSRLLAQIDPTLQIVAHQSHLETLAKLPIFEKNIGECDILIYHPVLYHKVTGFNSAQFLPKLKPSAIVISVQNLFFPLYWPTGEFSPQMKKRIAELAGQEVELQDYSINAEYHLNNWVANEKSRNEQRKFDIQITDWILDNFRKSKLFYTSQHCVNQVFIELLRRILLFLKEKHNLNFLKDRTFEAVQISLNQNPEWQCQIEIPIMPEVEKAFGFEFNCNRASYAGRGKCTIDEYLRQFIKGESQTKNGK